MTWLFYWFWECEDCGWISNSQLIQKESYEKDTAKLDGCPKCNSSQIVRRYNSLMRGVKVYTDEAGGFSVTYPYVENWRITNKGPGFVVFANVVARATMAVSYSKIPMATLDPWDIETQVQVVKGLAFTLKQLFSQNFENHKIVSTEKITNPNNQVKGFELQVTFQSRDKMIKAKCLSYIQKQNKYDIIATALERDFNVADKYFFRPVIENFTF